LQARHSPAAERNRQPILEVLRQVLPGRGAALEIASGTGQHAAWFATGMPGWTWQPSDTDAQALPSIAQWCAQAGAAMPPPVLLDVSAALWPQAGAAFPGLFDAIYCANMLHIAPWGACAGLMQGAARHLAPSGALITYGPYWEEGVAAAASNIAFDESLRARNPEWGIRSIQDVRGQARQAGLELETRVAMPANNLLLVFRRPRPSPAP
jgi:hypothetical protein